MGLGVSPLRPEETIMKHDSTRDVKTTQDSIGIARFGGLVVH